VLSCLALSCLVSSLSCIGLSFSQVVLSCLVLFCCLASPRLILYSLLFSCCLVSYLVVLGYLTLSSLVLTCFVLSFSCCVDLSRLVLSSDVFSCFCLVFSCVLSCVILCYLVLCCVFLSCRVVSCLNFSFLTVSCLVVGKVFLSTMPAVSTNDVVSLLMPQDANTWAPYHPTFTYFAFGLDETLDTTSEDATGIEKILFKFTPSTARCLLSVKMVPEHEEDKEMCARALKFATRLFIGGAPTPCPASTTDKNESDPDALEDEDISLTPRALPEDFTTDDGAFQVMHEEDLSNFTPFGEQVGSYTVREDEFVIFKSEAAPSGTAACSLQRKYHERVEKLALFFIEGADFVDVKDDRWTLYYLYRKGAHGKPSSSSKRAKLDYGRAEEASVGSCSVYFLAGYYTVFQFRNPFCGAMWRICQALILPQFQRQGHGSMLYRHVFQEARKSSEVVTVTVEDPAPAFKVLRDVEDVQECCRNNLFSSNSESYEEDRQKVKEVLKLTPQQALRCQEILNYHNLDKSNEAACTAYRLTVKRRLHKEHAISSMDESLRKQKLEDLYKNVEKDYIQIIDKIRRY
jgi:histone acetyltransferase 1